MAQQKSKEKSEEKAELSSTHKKTSNGNEWNTELCRTLQLELSFDMASTEALLQKLGVGLDIQLLPTRLRDIARSRLGI